MFNRLDMTCAIVIAGCIGYIGGFRSAKERFCKIVNDWVLSRLDEDKKPDSNEQEEQA